MFKRLAGSLLQRYADRSHYYIDEGICEHFGAFTMHWFQAKYFSYHLIKACKENEVYSGNKNYPISVDGINPVFAYWRIARWNSSTPYGVARRKVLTTLLNNLTEVADKNKC